MPDVEHGRTRHWLQSFFAGQQKSQRRQDEAAMDDENPWFALQHKASNEGNNHSVTSAPVRWLTDESSPNGFSDDDGTLKQVDNPVWRRAFGSRNANSGRFVPRGRSPSRWQTDSKDRTAAPSRGSTWLMQTVAAAVLVAGGFYVNHMHTPISATVGGVYHSAFSKDDATELWSSVDAFMTSHHVPVPTALNIHTAIRFHNPVNGTVEQGYSDSHPLLTYRSTRGAKVYAAGSGTVIKVETTGNTKTITIDHGQGDDTIYSNVASSAVKTGEYVSTGQVIGHLSNQATPTLGFQFERDGQSVNPANYLQSSQGGV